LKQELAQTVPSINNITQFTQKTSSKGQQLTNVNKCHLNNNKICLC